jgi:hypothetical protein
MPVLTTARRSRADGPAVIGFWSGAEGIGAMSSVLERRLSRLEQAVGSRPDELMECGEISDQAKDILRTVYDAMCMAPKEIEARVNQRCLTPCDQVADLSPVEREQRLLAIRGMVAENAAAKALLERALDKSRAGGPPAQS